MKMKGSSWLGRSYIPVDKITKIQSHPILMARLQDSVDVPLAFPAMLYFALRISVYEGSWNKLSARSERCHWDNIERQ